MTLTVISLPYRINVVKRRRICMQTALVKTADTALAAWHALTVQVVGFPAGFRVLLFTRIKAID